MTPPNDRSFQFRYLRCFLLCVLSLAGLLVTGCQSFNSPPPGNLASVTVTNKSLDEISQATRAVFAVHGFDGSQTSPSQFNYERAGTRANNLAYGSYIFNEAVTIRVQVNLTPLDAASTRIGCNAWLVEDANDSVFQDDHKVRQLRKWPYDDLLKDIKAQLGQ